ncbi:MAG: GHKL domain-containing protein, partial [Lachnospiraceae bacterium]|nr:GHKL domain-containing protein [Lachnospiraceae bacterium]
VYYLFDYSFTKLSGLLYSGNKVVVEFMGFAYCISYLAFLIVYFREYEKKQEIKQYSDLMKMQLLSIQKEIGQIKRSKKKLSILRHDMRHHLNIILTQLQNDNIEKAIEYIEEIGDFNDDTTIITYCKNEMINSVISIYQTWFADKKITLKCDISLREGALPCQDIVIGTILSNALENSMNALDKMATEEKWVNLIISEKQDHLLLKIENPIVNPPRFVDGVPASGKKGHGIGVKSIVYYVEQLNGQCHFSTTDHSFVLRIII